MNLNFSYNVVCFYHMQNNMGCNSSHSVAVSKPDRTIPNKARGPLTEREVSQKPRTDDHCNITVLMWLEYFTIKRYYSLSHYSHHCQFGP